MRARFDDLAPRLPTIPRTRMSTSSGSRSRNTVRGLTAAVVAAERRAVADHRLTHDRGPPHAVGKLAAESCEQAIRVCHGRSYRRWIGTVGDVQLRRNQLVGHDQTRIDSRAA